MKNRRNYGIDLLRLVLMFMVCMLHTLGQGGVLSIYDVGTLEYNIFWFLEILSYGAVDGYAIISGYMANDRSYKCEKLVEMWFQVFFYSFVLTLFFTLTGINEEWKLIDIIRCLLPITFEKYWYFTAFFALFFATPILNKFIFSADTYTCKKAFIICIVLFSIMGIIADPFKTLAGGSAIWLIVLYCIGALAKRIELFERKKSTILVAMWIGCILSTWYIYTFLGIQRLINYISPTILMSSLLMVILFSRIKLKGIIVKKLSPLVFGIYLFQLNEIVWHKFINGALIFLAEKNIIEGIITVFGFAASIFILGIFIEFIRSKIDRFLKISILSKKIVEKLRGVMYKIFVLLE